MTRSIGFDRPLRLDWLDVVADRWASTDDVDAATRDVRALVSATTGGGDSPHNATGKTLTVLARTWLKVPVGVQDLRDRAAAELPRSSPSDRLAIHWAMCEVAYPFYLDAAQAVGQALEISDGVTLAAVRSRLTESWGARGTMPAATQRLMKMWAAWGVLDAVDGRGTYRRLPPFEVSAGAATIMAEARVRATQSQAMDVEDLQRSPDLFPFRLPDMRRAAEASPGMYVAREGSRRWVARPAA